MNKSFLLTDTGPLVALVNTLDAHHKACVTILRPLLSRNVTLLTTLSCLTEAAYLLYREGGKNYVDGLWNLWELGALSVHAFESGEIQRVRQLMNTYHDSPMDLADASIVATAETLGTHRIFTLDSHFYAYRTAGGDSFEVIP